MNSKKSTFSLPDQRTVLLIHLFEGTQNPAAKYFNAKRMLGGYFPETKECYQRKVKTYVQDLAAAIISENQEITAILSPPSTPDEADQKTDSDPYREEIEKNLSTSEIENFVDLTTRFSRADGVKSSNQQTTLEGLIKALTYEHAGDESSFKSLLIVDESISSGKTVQALLHHLYKSGLSHSCKIIVAVVVKMK